MRYLLIAIALVLLPVPALATGTTYRGSLEVPTTGAIIFDTGGSGCGVFINGVQSVAACPTGTATFLGGTNISVTGSNPYTINCPLCFNVNASTTVNGSTTFTSPVLFTTGLSSNFGFANNSTSTPVSSGTTGAYSAGYQIGTPGGFSVLSTTASSIGTCGITGNALAVTGPTGTLLDTFDQSGNMCSAGTAYYVSARSEKQDIHEANIDALDVMAHADFNLFWRYKPGIGNPNQEHYGPMADTLPEYISGPKHGRIDLQALVSTEGAAINQLNARLMFAYMAIGLLVVWCFALTVVVVRART